MSDFFKTNNGITTSSTAVLFHENGYSQNPFNNYNNSYEKENLYKRGRNNNLPIIRDTPEEDED